jgi:hypothetical protein
MLESAHRAPQLVGKDYKSHNHEEVRGIANVLMWGSLTRTRSRMFSIRSNVQVKCLLDVSVHDGSVERGSRKPED